MSAGDNSSSLLRPDDMDKMGSVKVNLPSLTESTTLESCQNSHEHFSPLSNGLHDLYQSMHLGFDGSSDRPSRPSRARSSTVNNLSRPSLPKSEGEPVAETPASSAERVPHTSDPAESVVPRKATRIVFMIRSKEVSSANVDCEKFESLQLPSSTVQTQRASLGEKIGRAVEKAKSPWKQTNKFVTENHPSQRKCRLEEAAAAGAATACQNIGSLNEVLADMKTPLTKKSAPKRKRASVSEDQAVVEGVAGEPMEDTSQSGLSSGPAEESASHLPSGCTATIRSMGGKTVLNMQLDTSDVGSTGGKTVFTPQPPPAPDTGSVGGKTIYLPPAPPYKDPRRQKKSSQSAGSSRKVSNASSEPPGSMETPSKTQPKPKRNSISSAKSNKKAPEGPENVNTPLKTQSTTKRNSFASTKQNTEASETSEVVDASPKTRPKSKKASSSSRKRGNTLSEASEQVEALTKTQSIRKRESVSSRELKELLEPHKSAAGIDMSFGLSFKDVPKQARSSRNLNPIYGLPQTSDSKAGSMEAALYKPPSVVASANIAAPMVRQKSSGSTMEPMFPNLLQTTSATLANQTDQATADFFVDTILTKKVPSASSLVTPNSKQTSRSKTNITTQTVEDAHENAKDIKALEIPEEAFNKGPPPSTKKSSDLSAPLTAGRSTTSYSVDSEGKKIPTPGKDSLPDSVQAVQPQPQGIPPIENLQQLAMASSVAATKSSLSQVMPETPTVQIAPRKMLPDALPPQQHSESLAIGAIHQKEDAPTRKSTWYVQLDNTV